MIALRFQAQQQQQQQEGPEAPDAPAAPGESTDDIVASILGDKPSKDKRPPREVQEEDEPEDATPPDDDEPEEEEELPPAAEDDDQEEDDEGGDDPADDEDDDEPAQGDDIKAARAALKSGDLDEAFRIAFGKKPEDVVPNTYVWTKWRQANERREQKFASDKRDAEAQINAAWGEVEQHRGRLHQTIEALKPYEKFYVAEQAFQRDGDPAHVVSIVQGITHMSWEEANKHVITKTRRSPAERQMQQRLAELEARDAERERQRTEQQQQQTVEQQRQSDLAFIRQSVTGDVTLLHRFDERIYRVLEKSKSPLGGLTLTIEQAAARVLRGEQKRLAKNPLLLKKKKKGVPPEVSSAGRTLRARAAPSPALRRNSQNNGASTAKDASTDEIVADILRAKPRRAS